MRDGGLRWEWYGGYEQICEVRGSACLIEFRRPRIGVFAHQIGSSTCRIRNGKLARTQNSLMSQFLMMISPISSHLSLSLPSPKNTKLSHPYLSLHAMIMSYQWVQHSPSTAYTKYCVHQVLHTPSTAYTEYCIHRVLHHPKIDCLSLPASLSSLGGPYCTQLSTFPRLRVNQWIECLVPSHLPPDLPFPDWPPSSTPPILIDHGLQVHIPTRLIIASKCISEFNLISASKCISKLARLRPPSASLSSLDHDFQVHLQTPLLTASKCISQLHDLDVQMHLPTRLIPASKCISESNSILASKCISKLTWSRPPSASLSYTILASKCISQLARTRPPSTSLS